MITLPKQTLPDVVPQNEIEAFQLAVRKPLAEVVAKCPEDVRGFISALANKLSHMAQVGEYVAMMTGDDLLLCGNSFEGKRIERNVLYPVKMPKLQVVDHYSTMHRLYARKGKQGLVDYCKAHVKGTELEKILSILTVYAFHEDAPRVTELLNQWRSNGETIPSK